MEMMKVFKQLLGITQVILTIIPGRYDIIHIYITRASALVAQYRAKAFGNEKGR